MSLLVLLGGPVGVGKSAAMDVLRDRMPGLGLLDADDVWRVSGDITDAARQQFWHANVNSVLRNYLQAGVDTCIISWVFARSELYQPIIDGLEGYVDDMIQLYLVASPEVIKNRIRRREDRRNAGVDIEQLIDFSLGRLEMIRRLPFDKIDTSLMTPLEVADAILGRVKAQNESV